MPVNTNIFMIRHAEKPDALDDKGLSTAGQERAEAYTIYFQNVKRGSSIIKFDYLFAAADSQESHRPRLTIKQLEKALGLSTDVTYKDKDYQNLADAILKNPKPKPDYNNANILICWHHGEILKLAQALGAPAASLPGNWPEDVFGWLLQLTFDARGNAAMQPIATQKLMYGDYGQDPPAAST